MIDKTGDGSEDMEQSDFVLEAKGIRKSFGELEVLRGISIQAREHDVISILGASGSGKSTFLRCLNFLEAPSSGEIYLRGERLETAQGKGNNLKFTNREQMRRFRSEMAMVFQQFNLWAHMTVLENVIEGPVSVLGKSKAEAISEAEGYLNEVGLYERKDYYPAHLSGGQQQRVAIARGLAMQPEVLLFDEPTSSLDPELVGEVLNVMQRLAEKGRTMVVVTHEMAFARDVSSHVIFLKDGLIEEEGGALEIMGSPKTEAFQKFLGRTNI